MKFIDLYNQHVKEAKLNWISKAKAALTGKRWVDPAHFKATSYTSEGVDIARKNQTLAKDHAARTVKNLPAVDPNITPVDPMARNIKEGPQILGRSGQNPKLQPLPTSAGATGPGNRPMNPRAKKPKSPAPKTPAQPVTEITSRPAGKPKKETPRLAAPAALTQVSTRPAQPGKKPLSTAAIAGATGAAGAGLGFGAGYMTGKKKKDKV